MIIYNRNTKEITSTQFVGGSAEMRNDLAKVDAAEVRVVYLIVSGSLKTYNEHSPSHYADLEIQMASGGGDYDDELDIAVGF